MSLPRKGMYEIAELIQCASANPMCYKLIFDYKLTSLFKLYFPWNMMAPVLT